MLRIISSLEGRLDLQLGRDRLKAGMIVVSVTLGAASVLGGMEAMGAT